MSRVLVLACPRPKSKGVLRGFEGAIPPIAPGDVKAMSGLTEMSPMLRTRMTQTAEVCGRGGELGTIGHHKTPDVIVVQDNRLETHPGASYS